MLPKNKYFEVLKLLPQRIQFRSNTTVNRRFLKLHININIIYINTLILSGETQNTTSQLQMKLMKRIYDEFCKRLKKKCSSKNSHSMKFTMRRGSFYAALKLIVFSFYARPSKSSERNKILSRVAIKIIEQMRQRGG